jgi:adenine deaminase
VEPVVFLPRRRYPDHMGDPTRHDLCLVGGLVADVREGTSSRAAIAVTGDRITGFGREADLSGRAARVIDVTGKTIVPGYIEPHTHALLANPAQLAYAIGAHGTTTAAVDALPLMMTAPPTHLADVLAALSRLPVSLRWLIRLHPQSFADEERFALRDLQDLWRQPFTAAVGEVTRWPDVLAGDPALLEKIAAARSDGRRVEGHAPGASYERLAALAAAGFTSCHEAITAADVANRLRAGLYVMLRYSSIRPDLPELLTGLSPEAIASGRVMLTVDGPSPAFLEAHGYQDGLLAIAMQSGLSPLQALRMVTVNPADYFGFADRGEIAVGRRADLNVLHALEDPRPTIVIAGGEVIADGGWHATAPDLPWAALVPPAQLPVLPDDVFRAPAEDAPVLTFTNDVILEQAPPSDAGVAALLVDRGGQWVTRCRLVGFADGVGGLATTISSAFDPLILGRDPADMARAYHRLRSQGGGIAVVEDGVERFTLPLDVGGIFSSRPWGEVAAANREFIAIMRSRGYRFADPLFSLLFLTFDSLPWVRLTSRGIWDVRRRKVISPSTSLAS